MAEEKTRAEARAPLGDYAARLPDVYAKGADSNNARLLRIPEGLLADAYADLLGNPGAGQWGVDDMTDLDRAFGRTLDLYGGMVGQPRGALNDSMYRYLIRNRVARNFVVGDYESVLDGIVAMFEATKKEIVLDDDPAKPGVVHLTRLPFAILSAAGFTASQALEMIEPLLPVGVRVEAENFEGTFAFAAGENELDHAAGFSDHPEPGRQTMGGYLGFAIGEDESTPLPI